MTEPKPRSLPGEYKDLNEVPCKECGDEYERDDMLYGMCADCYDNFKRNDLEYQIEKAMYGRD